ncbi:MAG: cyclopropane-fatty-acyl-phospholipid synthase family protein [Geminicoccaceae bacterium]
MKTAIELAESGVLPDPMIRIGIRRMLRRRLEEEAAAAAERARWRAGLASAPVTIHADAANAQHYEVPTAFFERVLGPRLKYSACLWPEGVGSLAEAEEAMLALTTERAEIAHGQRILELGCGWGSLCLYLAERFPTARITALSNSRTQRAFIERRARERSLANLEVVTTDVAAFDTAERFDRIVSVEMFEHVRNHRELFRRIGRWLRPGGKLFVHVFAHRIYAYPFEDEGPATWMARHFFTGGLMPSLDLLPEAARDVLELEESWTVDGTHYQKTLEAWLAEQDAARAELLPLFTATYGAKDARLWFQRWRIFFMACAELFGFRDGTEWLVAHYRWRAPGRA